MKKSNVFVAVMALSLASPLLSMGEETKPSTQVKCIKEQSAESSKKSHSNEKELKGDGALTKSKVMVQGQEYSVAVYALEKPLKLLPIYKTRKDINKYSWMKPLLMGYSDYGVNESKSVLQSYIETPITDELYKRFKQKAVHMRRAVTIDQKEHFKGAYSELKYIVWYKSNDSENLSFFLDFKYEDGRNPETDTYNRLKLVDGKWKLPDDRKTGYMAVIKAQECYEKAITLLKSGKLKTLSVSLLK
jgi:hypothetical protein